MFFPILKRILVTIPVLLIIITATFFLVRMAPGNPFDEEKSFTPETLAALNAHYGLDRPLHQQYFDYLGKLLQGNLGPSLRYPGRTVQEIIWNGLPTTLELGAWALLFALCLGLGAGIIAALRPNTAQDYIPMACAMVGLCLPAFLLGPLLVLLLSIQVQWLPVAGWGSLPGDKILPVCTLGTAYAAYIARLSRGGILEVLRQPFVRTARAKGLSETRILFYHVLRGGLIPVMAFLGPAVAGLLAGSFVVETVFQVPGMGRFYVQAAFNRDYTMVLGMTIFFATLIILLNLLSDVLLLYLDPRLRDPAR